MYCVICKFAGAEKVNTGFKTAEQADIWTAKCKQLFPSYEYRTVPQMLDPFEVPRMDDEQWKSWRSSRVKRRTTEDKAH